MKQIKHKPLFVIVMCQFLLLFFSCNVKTKDMTVKEDLATRAKGEQDFAGVRMRVEIGIVTANGECATQKSKSTVETTIKSVYGVKNVINNITVAPVVIGTDEQLKECVDSVLNEYPGVEAITKDSIVYLQGKLANDKALKLRYAISSLKPKMVDARFTSR